jgi:hypothetical protein
MSTFEPTFSIDEDRYQHLQEIAQRQGNSINETLHEIIDLGIAKKRR